MHEQLFLIILDMSVAASYVLVCVLGLRLLLRRAPRWVAYAAWLLVLFRLVSPVSFSAPFALLGNLRLPGTDRQMPAPAGISAGLGLADAPGTPLSPVMPAAPNTPLHVLPVAAWIWLAGLALLLGYALVTTIRVKHQTRLAQRLFDNVYESASVPSPFIFGLFRPRVFIPIGLGDCERSLVLRHERVHLKRLDHLVKPFAFAVLAVHWFNPLVWLAYRQMSLDMETSCDESVTRDMNRQERARYSETLVRLAVKQPVLAAGPLAFGESGTGTRIRNILNPKKPAIWITAAAVLALIIAAVLLLADPLRQPKVDDLVLPLLFEDQIERQGRENKAYLAANQDKLERIARYLEDTTDKFGTRPVPLSLQNMDLVRKITDAAIRQDLLDILSEGTVKAVLTGLDGGPHIKFYLNTGPNEYEQGFYHTKADRLDEAAVGKPGDPPYNQVQRYEKLDSHWFGFMRALADIRDADQYRQAAWAHMGPDGQKIVIGDWRDARVTLTDWEQVGKKLDDKNRPFVVLVQFRHKNEGILGPIGVYLDAVTKKVVGIALLA